MDEDYRMGGSDDSDLERGLLLNEIEMGIEKELIEKANVESTILADEEMRLERDNGLVDDINKQEEFDLEKDFQLEFNESLAIDLSDYEEQAKFFDINPTFTSCNKSYQKSKDPYLNYTSKEQLVNQFSSPNSTDLQMMALSNPLERLDIGNNKKARLDPDVMDTGLDKDESREAINYYQPSQYGKFITVTNSKGKTLYVPRKSVASTALDSSVQKSILANSKLDLLTVPMHKILDLIEQKQVRKYENRINELEEREKQETLDLNFIKSGTLWVDKYKPNNYIDLVGDQRVNREALEWLKSWDPCVFGKEPSTKSYLRPSTGGHINQLVNDEIQKKEDSHFRPEKKILMLCGPPGLGKTSLAHVLAKHCGYNCIEINASDDRTASVVKDRIYSAIENQSLFGGGKPNLILIDEIDGVSSAGGGDSFINVLIQMVNNPANSNFVSEDQSGFKRKKDKILKRPIICICNDQFTPSLRALRPFCEIFSVKRSTASTLVSHLKEICSAEKVDISPHTLTTLAEITECDLRSSINTLQFLSKSNRGRITEEMVSNGQFGLKDSPKSLFHIWEAVFTLPSSKLSMNRKRGIDDELGVFKVKNRYLDQVLSMINSYGGHNIIIEGCFENYLNTKYIDIYMDKICQANEYLAMFDDLNARYHTRQQHELYNYLAYPILAFHPLFASAYVKNLEYPKAERNCRELMTKNINLMHTVYRSFKPRLQSILPQSSLTTYLLHLAHHIINPDLTKLNIQLININDKKKMDRLVDRMLGFGFSYRQIKDDTNRFDYILEPPINGLIKLQVESSTAGEYGKNKLRYEIKQFVAQEVEKARVRQKELAYIIKNQARCNKRKGQDIDEKETKNPFGLLKNSVQAQKPLPKEVEPEPLKFKLEAKVLHQLPPSKKKRKDPFQSFIKIKDSSIETPSQAITPKMVNRKAKVFYKFQDGYSNAVRTNCYVEDFL